MSVVQNIYDLSENISNNSNDISNRITNLFTNDVTLEKNLTIGGDLTVNGTTATVNTDSYTTEILEITRTNLIDNRPLLKVEEYGTISNIIEVYKGADKVLNIDNSGKLITSDAEINGGMIVKETTTIKSLLDLNFREGFDNDERRGIRMLSASSTDFAFYSAPSNSEGGKSFAGNNACDGVNNLNSWAIRLRTLNHSAHGIIYETSDEVCKFSVNGDGKGYFAGGLLVKDGNIDFEKDAPYFYIKDSTATSEGLPTTMAIHTNSGRGYILGKDNAACLHFDLRTKYAQFYGNVDVRGLSVANKYEKILTGTFASGTEYTIFDGSTAPEAGVYIVIVYLNNYLATGGHYTYTYTSVPFYWYGNGGTNGTVMHELPQLQGSGHANNNYGPPKIRYYERPSSTMIMKVVPNFPWTSLDNTIGKSVIISLKRIA